MKLDPFHWEISSTIDLEAYLNKHPPNFNYKIDHFYYILEYLSIGMERGDVDKNEGYVNVNAAKLQRRIHNYKQYLDHMLNHKLILTDGRYVVGEKSKGYLISGYRSTVSTTINSIPITDSVVKKNRRKDINDYNSKLEKTAKRYKYLTKWFNKDLKIDYALATEEILGIYPPYTRPIGGKKWGEASRHTKIIIASQALFKFHKQHFYYQVDDNVRRFHSNLTNLKKELRNYITYNNNLLINIDIRNSQPLFSLILLNKEFYNPKSSHNIYQYSHIFSTIPSITTYGFSLMLVKHLQNTDNKVFNEYVDMVNSGEFYKRISDKIFPGREFNKKNIKVMIFTVLFSDNRFIGQPEADSKMAFKTHFPDVYKVFSLIKKKDKTILARILQMIESDIIINRVSQRISREKPEIPIFTIHDSVATIIGYEDYVANIINEEVKNFTDLDVKLGYEYWKPKIKNSITPATN